MLELAVKHKNVKVSIARPGGVLTSQTWSKAALSSSISFVNFFTGAIPAVTLEEVGAATVDQIVHGFKKEILSNAELVEAGRAVLATENKRG